MSSYDEFIKTFSVLSNLKGNKNAEAIFDFLHEEQTIIEMAKYSDAGLTALSAVVDQVVSLAAMGNNGLDLSQRWARQCVGRFFSDALEPLGYVPCARGRVRSKNGSPFSTAAIYSLNGPATKRIESHIVDI